MHTRTRTHARTSLRKFCSKSRLRSCSVFLMCSSSSTIDESCVRACKGVHCEARARARVCVLVRAPGVNACAQVYALHACACSYRAVIAVAAAGGCTPL
jgi:hypothetical protein